MASRLFICAKLIHRFTGGGRATAAPGRQVGVVCLQSNSFERCNILVVFSKWWGSLASMQSTSLWPVELTIH